MQLLDHYIKKFQKLRSDRNSPWPELSYGRSPYKPLLLMAVIDLFEQGQITTNLIWKQRLEKPEKNLLGF